MISVIGRSGSGKSILFRMMNYLTSASSDATLPSCAARPSATWQSQCAIGFQQFILVPRMDVVSDMLRCMLNCRSRVATMFNIFQQADIIRASDI